MMISILVLILYAILSLSILIAAVWTPIHCGLNKDLDFWPKVGWVLSMSCLPTWPFYWFWLGKSRFWKIFSGVQLGLLVTFPVIAVIWVPKMLHSPAVQEAMREILAGQENLDPQIKAVLSTVEKKSRQNPSVKTYDSPEIQSRQIATEVSREEWRGLEENLFSLQTEVDTLHDSRRKKVASELLSYYAHLTSDHELSRGEFEEWRKQYRLRKRLRPGFPKKYAPPEKE